ncbi:DNA cytosine methyltransferase [Buchananella felis]|uniref:DNA cytosine methyltransferase n=1 Tax=Buchananella felis TaxID=3231492 RepID=UPI003529049E
MTYTSVEICAGAGGQARGLELAGFKHLAAVEIDKHACQTLRLNRPEWNPIEADLTTWEGHEFSGKVDLLAGGVPCPPFSKAGRQLGADDERDLFPHAIRLVGEIQPRAVMLENVRGLLDTAFDDYRASVERRLRALGYNVGWRLLNASDFGVPQLRPRVVFIGVREDLGTGFEFPHPADCAPPTVGQTLRDLMAENGWEGAGDWAAKADSVAPTLVGGSKKHGGADLGPTRAKRAWEALGVDGKGIADSAPPVGFEGLPRLTNRMAARIQGFDDDWVFSGGKTAQYRQIGNAFPPPVAAAVGRKIFATLANADRIEVGVSRKAS